MIRSPFKWVGGKSRLRKKIISMLPPHECYVEVFSGAAWVLFGKDPSKVDRSASYMCRHIAKNIVAAGLADRCEIQVSYAIGYPDPLSVLVDTEGTAKIREEEIVKLVQKIFPLRPRTIIDYLNLKRPIYRKTACHGHFGRNEPEFTWEKTNKAAELKRAAKLK